MKTETDILRVAMSILGKRSAQKLTKAQRVEKGKKAIEIRWERYRNEQKQKSR